MEIIKSFKMFTEKKETKTIAKKDDFFKVCSVLDKKYFPDVKYYRDDKNNADVHYAVELFNNGALTYKKLITRLAKNCKDTEKNIHKIVKKYIDDFGDFDESVYENYQLNEGKKDEVALPNSNLYLSGFNMDRNGNPVVKIAFADEKAFSFIISNGSFTKTYSISKEFNKGNIKELSNKELSIIEKECVGYIERNGSESQKKKLKYLI